MASKLSIIVITYNVREKAIKCLERIIDLEDTEIIVIDNASRDETASILQNKLKNKIKLFANKQNTGFAKAVNQGIKEATGELILLLNPDTIPTNKAINILKKVFDNDKEKIGLVGGRLIKPGSKTIHGTYVNKPHFLTGIFEFTNLKKIFKENTYSREFYYKDKGKVNKPLLVYGLSGGFLMFRKGLIKEVGYLDENFFMYLEDVDFGVRTRALGYKNYYIPSAEIIHDSGSSSSHSKYKIHVKAWRNSRNYYFKKYSNFLQWFILRTLFFIDDLIIDTKHRLANEPLT